MSYEPQLAMTCCCSSS